MTFPERHVYCVSTFWEMLLKAYSYRDPNCSDSPLEYDNSRLSLDENCHILEENYTNLVSFFSNSRVRITHSLSTTTRITFLQVIFVYPDFAIFLMYFF